MPQIQWGLRLQFLQEANTECLLLQNLNALVVRYRKRKREREGGKETFLKDPLLAECCAGAQEILVDHPVKDSFYK